MQSSSSRQEILQRIATAPKRRSACLDKKGSDEIYRPIYPDATTCFKKELEEINGKCIVCKDEIDLYARLKDFLEQEGLETLFCRDSYISDQLARYQISFTSDQHSFEKMQAGITGCEFLIARTGSVLVSSASPSGRQMNVFPPVHIVLAHISQLVDYPEDAYLAMLQKYDDQLPSAMTTITGPSRTADIEKTLVLGAHGPKEFIVFLCKE